MKIFPRTTSARRSPWMTPVERTQYYDTLTRHYIDERRIFLKDIVDKRTIEERLFNQRVNEKERVERLKEYGKGDYIDVMV